MRLLVALILWTAVPSISQVKILFNATKAETAANADWQVDADIFNVSFGGGNPSTTGSGTEANPQRYPSPNQSGVTASTPENYWKGGLSAWAIECVKRGYLVETLPIGSSITYGVTTNPQDLTHYQVYVVCEPNILFTAAEKTAILQFVQNGGGLMMVANHDMSDRNFDGFDSPSIWNDLMGSGNPFGFIFELQNFSQTTSNVPNLPSDPILSGPYGNVTKMQYSAGTTMTLTPTTNPTVKGIVYKTGSSFGNSNVMFAYAKYGNGKVAAMGDSSPADDGTGDDNDVLYDGWVADADGNHRKLLMNATVWLATPTITPISLTSSQVNVACFGGNTGKASVVAMGGLPPYLYQWSNGSTNSTADLLIAGTYTVTVTGGSTSSATIVITEPSDINISTTIENITCSQPSGKIMTSVMGGKPGYQYSWSDGSTAENLLTTIPGSFQLTLTDQNGCKKMINQTISQDIAPPDATIQTMDTTITCVNPVVSLTAASATPGVTFEWASTIPISQQQMISVISAGVYMLKVTNPANGCTKVVNIQINENKVLPSAAIAGGDTLSCYNKNIALNATTDDKQYQWFSNGHLLDTSQIIQVSSPGKYILRVLDLINGCTNSDSIIIGINNDTVEIASFFISNATNHLANGSITITAVGGRMPYEFSWRNADGIIISHAQNLTDVTDGRFFLDIKDANGCNTSKEFVINNIITATHHNSLQNAILVFPNPVLEIVQIQISLDDNITLEIYNIFGQLISKNVSVKSGSLSLESFPDGQYIFKFTNRQNTFYTTIHKM